MCKILHLYLTNTFLWLLGYLRVIFVFQLKSLCKKNILTNQMKNEYFQENLEKRIKIIREMILSKIPNEILERKSKSQGKRRFFGTLFGLITSKKIFISL